jgi:predicted phage replisome organizer
MTDNKKYYWLKLKNDFFRDKEIKKLRRVAGGDTFTIIYLKLQLLSLKNGGKLYFDNLEETFAEELALELDEEVENIKITLLYLKKCGLIQEASNNEYLLTQTIECIGKETASAGRVRRYRQKKKMLQCNGSALLCNTELDIELELEKELENNNMAHPSDACKRQKKKLDQYSPEFEEAWASYPKRSGSNSKLAAYKNWKTRIAEGVTVQDLISASRNYQAFLAANGNINTPYVMQAQRFYGANREYEQFITIKSEDLINVRNRPTTASERSRQITNKLLELHAKAEEDLRNFPNDEGSMGK